MDIGESSSLSFKELESEIASLCNGYQKKDQSFATRAIHAGQDTDKWTYMPVVPPISLATTFKQDGPAEHRGFDYSRGGNPTRDVLEKCLASLDGAKYGRCYSSGLAAMMAITQMLKHGDHVVSMDDIYGGSYRYLNTIASRMNIETTFVDARDVKDVEKVMKPNTKLIWIETPTNPTLKIVDIKSVSDMVHKKNKDIIVAVDNTFLTSYFQLPLLLGADLVCYSLTKYMNGHSDVVMGAITTNRQDLNDQLTYLQKATGAIPSPFDCFLVNRGLKTLHLRMKEHMRNALLVGRFLEKHSCVSSVIHPGLPSHPQHDLIKKQCYGYSGMLSFNIRGGLQQSKIFLQTLKVFTLAESLGGYESLAELPSLMTHASVSEEDRRKLGISDTFIRLSVGLESPEELIHDLDQALKSAVKDLI